MPPVTADRHLSGADIESIVLLAKRRSLAANRQDQPDLQPADLEAALGDFIPSAQGLEKEMQELAAVLECTQLNFLPPDLQLKIAQPDGRARMQERFIGDPPAVERITQRL